MIGKARRRPKDNSARLRQCADLPCACSYEWYGLGLLRPVDTVCHVQRCRNSCSWEWRESHCQNAVLTRFDGGPATILLNKAFCVRTTHHDVHSSEGSRSRIRQSYCFPGGAGRALLLWFERQTPGTKRHCFRWSRLSGSSC